MSMLNAVAKKILGSQHLREAKKLQPIVDEINEIYAGYETLSESELKRKTQNFRTRIETTTSELTSKIEQLQTEKRNSEDSEKRQELQERIADCDEELMVITGEILTEILPEAFATVKETCRRLVGTEIIVSGQKQIWDMVPYDVQLIGGIALHRGKVAEMATGEGKTLVATMPLYLNALVGRGSHLVTVNPYLARRDSEWMGTIYKYLGLTVDCIDNYEPHSAERVAAYQADITYGTNNEFGFDYLRDNMVYSLD
ncbi:uncharacterized protein METZ01_LOCUS105206, partial [marine metagenome]